MKISLITSRNVSLDIELNLRSLSHSPAKPQTQANKEAMKLISMRNLKSIPGQVCCVERHQSTHHLTKSFSSMLLTTCHVETCGEHLFNSNVKCVSKLCRDDELKHIIISIVYAVSTKNGDAQLAHKHTCVTLINKNTGESYKAFISAEKGKESLTLVYKHILVD